MKKLTALILSAGLLAGCITMQDYEGIMSTWIGASEVEVVRAFGVPTSSYDSAGSRFLSFQDERVYVDMYGGGTLRCTTLFELRDGRVVDWSAEGNSCLNNAPPSRA
jgi:hypothetical protein